MDKCVVSFGISSSYDRPMYKWVDFEKGVDLLRLNVEALGYDFMGWNEDWPEGWPTMRNCPYGFKFYAIKEAWDKGYKHVMWADSSAKFKKNGLDDGFALIEKDGYFFPSRSGNIMCTPYVANYFGYSSEQVLGFQGLMGKYFGLSFDSNVARCFFDAIFDLTKTGDMFRGTKNIKDFVLSEHWKVHRADQAVISLLVHKMGLKASAPLVGTENHGNNVKEKKWIGL